MLQDPSQHKLSWSLPNSSIRAATPEHGTLYSGLQVPASDAVPCRSMLCCDVPAGLEAAYEAANTQLVEAQVTAAEAQAAVQAADAHTQSKQSLYDHAVAARDAAKAAYDVAQQDLRLVEQAAQNASAALVKISETAMAAQGKMDSTQAKAADGSRKVWGTPWGRCHQHIRDGCQSPVHNRLGGDTRCWLCMQWCTSA